MLKSLLCIAALCAVPVLTEEDELRPPVGWRFPTAAGRQLMAAVGGQHVFVLGSDLQTESEIYGLSRKTGKLVWQASTGGPDITRPIVSGDKVYTSTGGASGGDGYMTVVSFDSDTSNEVQNWRWNDPRSPPVQQSSIAASIDDSLVFVTTSYLDQVFAIYSADSTDGDAGTTAWSRSISNSSTSGYHDPPLAPTYDPETGYVFAATTGYLMAMEAATGEPVWTYEGLHLTDAPIATNGTLLVGCKNSDAPGIYAFNARNGIFLWFIQTQAFPSAPTAFKDGTGRIAFSVLPHGTTPGGVWVLNQTDIEFEGVFYGVDASAGAKSDVPRENTTAVKYLMQTESSQECKDGCKQAYCNVTSFIWYSEGDTNWKYGCYCRIDGIWVTTQNSTCTSGKWGPPSVNWTYSDSGSTGSLNSLWSSPASSLIDSTVYVNAVNVSHEMIYALQEGTVKWLFAFELAVSTFFVPPSVPAVCHDSVIFASMNGTVVSFAVGKIPGPATPWYKQAKWLSTITGGVIVIAALTLCFCYNRGGRDELGHTSPGRKYQVISKLGSGSYGVVYLVRRRSDKVLFALKYLSCDSDDAQERALLEFRTMRSYQGHPNMIKVVETFMNWSDSTDESDEKGGEPLLEDMKKFNSPKYVCLVMPFYRQGDLKQFALNYSETIPERLLLDFAAQICSLLQYLHDRDQPLIHRDLKPENVLLADDMKSVIVTDFGLAKKMHNRYCATRAGTLCYMAPECWSHHYGKEADIWAAGCILYSVASRRVEEHNIRVMFSEALQTECFQTQIADELEEMGYPVLAQLVSLMLEPDYHTRPVAVDVLTWLGVGRYAEGGVCPVGSVITVDPAKVSIPPLSERPVRQDSSTRAGSTFETSRGSVPLVGHGMSSINVQEEDVDMSDKGQASD